MARKTKLETYVDRELEQQIDDACEERGIGISAFLREAARHELQNMEAFNNE